MRGNQHHKKGEYIMTNRVVEHKIKLEKSLTIILGVLALGVFLNSFAPAFSVKDAFAEVDQFWGTSQRPFVVKFEVGGKKDYAGYAEPIEFKCIDCK